MNRKLTMIIALQAFLIIVLFWVLVFYGKDEYEATTHEVDDKIETPNRISKNAGISIITVGIATQTQSGIETNPIKASTYQGRIASYGNVIAIDGLTELRSRYLAAKAEADIVRATLTNTKAEYNRLRELNLDDKNVSDKSVATALASIQTDEARIVAADIAAKNIADSMRQAWGDVLAKLAIQPTLNPMLSNLVNTKNILIQTTLPFDATEPKENSRLTIAPTGAPTREIEAYFISRAPASNATIQGKTYFYYAAATDFRAGMQVKVQSAQSQVNLKGVIVPASAVVWHAGKPWAYLQHRPDKFQRIPITTDIEVENGWFNQIATLKAGDNIVTSGAQLLLSEEFKSLITNENDD